MEKTANNKALIAMSGGVDSSVAAYLMQRQGWDCGGVTLKLFGGGSSCCSLEDIEDARSVACALEMPFYVFNFQDEFEERVIWKFVRAYETGLTPNPCIDCNRYLKFGKLMERARELGYDRVATGHYARIEEQNGRRLLLRAADNHKDQTYVLYSMTQEQLAHTVFPLGELNKSQVRRIAEELGFINAKKRDSQDICFVRDSDFGAFIEEYSRKTYPPGDFVGKNGALLGKHRGIVRYTVGQRKGLGLALPKPMYVCEKRADTNTVVLGESDDLMCGALDAEDINLIAADSLPCQTRVTAKIRYGAKEAAATVEQTGKDSLHVVFDEPQRAAAPGQAVVLYDGEYVIGGGTIIRGY